MGKTVEHRPKQNDRIIAYINEHGSITQHDAHKIGVARLASRICDLRRLGYVIETKREKVKTQYNGVTSICRYSLKGEEDGEE